MKTNVYLQALVQGTTCTKEVRVLLLALAKVWGQTMHHRVSPRGNCVSRKGSIAEYSLAHLLDTNVTQLAMTGTNPFFPAFCLRKTKCTFYLRVCFCMQEHMV